MNTTVSKSFGLALLLAVGIIAVMVALGTFSAQKAGAQVLDDDDVTLAIESATPAPGAAVQIQLSFTAGDDLDSFGTMEIELEGYSIPSTIDPKNVLIRSADEAGLPVDVTVAGQVITLELNEDPTAGVGTQEITSGEAVVIVLRQRAGITAPALAGTYDVRVDDRTLENAVTVSATLSTDPKKGGSGTDITVTGKAFANGTGTLASQTLDDPDYNNDGIIDKVIITAAGDDGPDGDTYTLDTNDDGEADFNIVASTATDATGWVAVPTDETNDANAVGLGYTISGVAGALDATRVPTLDTTYNDDAESLTSVTVAGGAFTTTVSAEDLVVGDNGMSYLRFTDANGDVARARFQVGGTVTLGADSVGKGRVLKIGLSDWITDVPNLVLIGGVPVDITDEDGGDMTPETVTVTERVEDDTVTPSTFITGTALEYAELDKDKAATLYVKVGGDVGLGTKTVVLFHSVTDTDDKNTTDDTEAHRDDDSTTITDTRLDASSVEITSLGLSVTPSTAVAGQEITVEGTGFGSGALSELTVDGIEQTQLSNRNDVADYDVLSGGRIVITFEVPAGVTDGSKTVRVTDDSDRVGEVSLTVPEPTITLNPTTSRRATTVTVTGSGFPSETNINVDFGEGETGIATGRTDNTGNFTASFNVPSDATIGGEVDVKASFTATRGAGADDDVTYEAEATHMVPDKGITVTPESARSGDVVEIDGTGFPRYSDVEINVGDGNFKNTDARTDDVGDFQLSYTLPGIDPGTHVVQARAGIEIGTFVITVPDAPRARAVGDVFAAPIENGSLQTIWAYDFDTGGWSSYTTDPETAFANDLFEVDSGDILYINVTGQQDFSHQKGETLPDGWSLITLK